MISMTLWIGEDARPSPKFEMFRQMFKQRFHATDDQIVNSLTKYGWHVYAFIQMTGAPGHLIDACVQASGLQGITHMSEQTLLEGFCGPESSAHHLKWVRRFAIPGDGKGSFGLFMQITFINLGGTNAFFTTPKGYMGLGPLGVKQGDLVCVLFGCHQTLVLRPVEDHYLVVGSCYVPGNNRRVDVGLGGVGCF